MWQLYEMPKSQTTCTVIKIQHTLKKTITQSTSLLTKRNHSATHSHGKTENDNWLMEVAEVLWWELPVLKKGGGIKGTFEIIWVVFVFQHFLQAL